MPYLNRMVILFSLSYKVIVRVLLHKKYKVARIQLQRNTKSALNAFIRKMRSGSFLLVW